MLEGNIDYTCSYGKEKLRIVQQILWDMYVQISDIFDKNGVKYFLSYGSMLGALRHNDFIPWDDDFDICVMQDDYDKAIKLLHDNLPLDKYVIHNKQSDPIYWLDFTKVRLLKSETFCTLWPDDNKFKYKGICLDIYRCWGDKQTRFTQKVKRSKVSVQFHFMYMIDAKKTLYSRLRSFCGVGYHILRYICYKIGDCLIPKKDVYVRDPESIVPSFNREYLFPLRYVIYRGRLCPVPFNAEMILKSQYGNWREMPDVSYRTTHYSKVEIWDEDYQR